MCRVSSSKLTMVALTISEDLANYIYENTTRATLDLDLQGIWINDGELFNALLLVLLILNLNIGVIDWIVAQSEIPAVHFVHKYEHVFAFKSVTLRLLFPIKINCRCVQSDIPRVYRFRRSKVQLRGLYGEAR